MIYCLTGRLLDKDPSAAMVDCGGVGYRCVVSAATLQSLPQVGSQVTLYTWLQVREDGVELFGFARKEERDLFQLLIGVSGVGPKAAVSILSTIPLQKLLLAISAGDAKAIKAPGVGPKTAQRIVLELKDKVGGVAGAAGVETASIPLSAMGESSALSEASSALVALGYSPSEAAAALSGLEDGLPVEELVKAGLKRLMRG